MAWTLPARPENPAPRILRAKVYDAIQVGAEEYGGIGWGVLFENDRPPLYNVNIALRGKPLEPFGIALVVMAGTMNPGDEIKQYVTKAFRDARLTDTEATHYAPRRILERNGWRSDCHWPRFSFREWCEELNIVRKVHKPKPPTGEQQHG